MNVDFKVTGDDRFRNLVGALKNPQTKVRLHHAAAYALRASVKDWIRTNSGKHHKTARTLGAQQTGHLEEAAATVTAEGTEDAARVAIHSAGFSRVFHALVIRPVRAKALTIPISKWAYGTTAAELGANGWSIFRPKRTRVLFGIGPGGGPPEPLFVLAGSALIPQDRTLLPPDEQIVDVCGDAMRKVLKRVLES